MTLKKCMSIVAFAAVGGAIAMGCSSSSTSGNTADGGTTGTTHPGDGGKTTSGGTGDSTGGDDGGIVDDTGTGEGGACTPADVSTFHPTWTPPAAASNACTQAMIDSFATCLDDSQTQSNPPSCTPWSGTPDAAHTACGQCIQTPSTAAALGPLVQDGNFVSLNIAGCVAIAEGKTDGSGCGGQIQAVDQCGNAACAANCANATDVNACITAAQSAGCKTYNDAATTCENAIPDGGKAADCFAGATFKDALSNIAAIFCAAGGSGDASTD